MKIDFSGMEKLGLSKQAIACYASLYTDGATVASKLAADINCRPANLYPLLNKLQTYGFIKSLKTNLGPPYYSAVSLQDALDRFFAYQRQQLLPIIREQRRRLPPK